MNTHTTESPAHPIPGLTPNRDWIAALFSAYLRAVQDLGMGDALPPARPLTDFAPPRSTPAPSTNWRSSSISHDAWLHGTNFRPQLHYRDGSPTAPTLPDAANGDVFPSAPAAISVPKVEPELIDAAADTLDGQSLDWHSADELCESGERDAVPSDAQPDFDESQNTTPAPVFNRRAGRRSNSHPNLRSKTGRPRTYTCLPNGDRVYVCDFEDCSAVYRSSWSLSRHKRLHMNLRPYQCPIDACPETFHRLDSMKSHHKSHARRIGKPLRGSKLSAADRVRAEADAAVDALMRDMEVLPHDGTAHPCAPSDGQGDASVQVYDWTTGSPAPASHGLANGSGSPTLELAEIPGYAPSYASSNCPSAAPSTPTSTVSSPSAQAFSAGAGMPPALDAFGIGAHGGLDADFLAGHFGHGAGAVELDIEVDAQAVWKELSVGLMRDEGMHGGGEVAIGDW